MTYTTNYQLPQWVKSDRIMMDDFNDANQKLDTALKNHDDTLDTLEATLLTLGNCQVYTTSYVGDEGTAPRVLPFPKKPLAVLVFGSDGYGIVALQGVHETAVLGSNGGFLDLSWSGNQLSWVTGGYGSIHLNEKDITYQVVAVAAA